MPKSLTTEEFKERIKQISNGNIEIIGEYKGINSPISCKCNKCGHVWKNTPNHLLYRGTPGDHILPKEYGTHSIFHWVHQRSQYSSLERPNW